MTPTLMLDVEPALSVIAMQYLASGERYPDAVRLAFEELFDVVGSDVLREHVTVWS